MLSAEILQALPGICYWKDTNLRYLGCNRIAAAATGLSIHQVEGKVDDNLIWASEAPAYRQQDQKVLLGQDVSVVERISIKGVESCYASTKKTPIYNTNNEILGVFGQAYLIMNPRVHKRLKDLFNHDACLYDGVEFSDYQILDEYPKLTKRETDCLFYFLRCYSAKVIAQKLCLSARTIEQHITSIKHKYRCQSRVDLLDFCFKKGLHKILIKSYLDAA